MEVGADPSPESIDRELARAEASKRRTRLIFAGSALFAVVGVVVLQLARSHQDERVLEKAWNDAAGCLFGGSVKPDEKASVRFRAIKLATAGKEERRKWPERCVDSLATLNHTLVQQKVGNDVANHAHKLMEELRKGHSTTNLSYAVDQLAESAAGVGLSLENIKRPEDKPPEKPASVWNITTLPESARLTDFAVAPHAVSSDRWAGADLNVLLREEGADDPPVLCTFVAGSPSAQCRKIAGPAAHAKELRLRGTHDQRVSPLLFGREMGQDIVFRSDTGEEVTRGNIQTAWLADTGYVALATGPIDDEVGTFELLQQPRPGAALTRHKLGPDNFNATTVMNWAVAYGQFVLQSVLVDEEAEERELPRFRSQPLPATDPENGWRDVGELDWVNAPMHFCASQKALVLKVGTRSGYLVFFQEGGWGTPSRRERLGSVVQCQNGKMLLHDFGPIRACDPSGCTDAGLTDASFGDLAVVRTRRTVLGDKLIGIAESEIREGIRYVVGTGEVHLLFDDLVRQGEVQTNSTISGTRIFSRDGFAVALLFSEDGVIAIYFGADGKPKPAKVSWSK